MKLLVALLLLAGLVVGADRVAEGMAEDALAAELEREFGARPDVEITGFPLLTQALRGTYDEILVDAPRVRQGAVELEDVQASLQGARVPLGDALGGAVEAVPVDTLVATGLVTYAQLETLSGEADLRLGPAGDRVRVEGSVRVLGRTIAASAVSEITLDGDTVVVRAQELEVEGVSPPAAVERVVRDRLDLRLPLPALPYDVELTRVQAGERGLTVSGSARGVVLQR